MKLTHLVEREWRSLTYWLAPAHVGSDETPLVSALWVIGGAVAFGALALNTLCQPGPLHALGWIILGVGILACAFPVQLIFMAAARHAQS